MRSLREADIPRQLMRRMHEGEEVKRFLRIFLSDFQWFRRWDGGKWALWGTSLPMKAIWLNQWERPPCGDALLAKEEW